MDQPLLLLPFALVAGALLALNVGLAALRLTGRTELADQLAAKLLPMTSLFRLP